MKKVVLCILIFPFLICCSTKPPKLSEKNYYIIGNSSELRAYAYGDHTIVEFKIEPSLLWVAPPIISFRDANGVNIHYEKEGRFFRLERIVDAFSMSLNGIVTEFNTSPISGQITPVDSENKAPPISNPTPISDEAAYNLTVLSNLRTVMQNQLDELTGFADAYKQRMSLEGIDLPALDRRTEALESKSKAIIQVSFPVGKAQFAPNDAVEYVLIPAAKLAYEIKLRGRTDSKTAGPRDTMLAKRRAISARDYLLANGIDQNKISVFYNPDGDFVVPGNSNESKAMNRRVEIELRFK